MYGDDPRDLGLGPQSDDPHDTRPKTDEEEETDTNRPRCMLYYEGFGEE